jgi:hypothetical protein
VLRHTRVPFYALVSLPKSQDNVTILIDGVLYVKVVDPVKASYGVDNALYAVSQLAQVCG